MPFEIDPDVDAVLSKLFGPQGAAAKPEERDHAVRRANLDALQAMINTTAVPTYDDVVLQDHYAPAKDGYKILVRSHIQKSKSEGKKAAVLYIHGGGMIAGNINSYNPIVTHYAGGTGVPFFNVEFRYAPEHPYPSSVEDCYAALQWLHSSAAEFNIDTSRIAIMGDSGGGGLSACLAHWVKQHNGPPVAKQILVYPMLDDRNVTPDPYLVPYAIWNYFDQTIAWSAVLGDKYGTDDVPVTAAAGRMTVEEAKGLPDTFLDVGELDLFRDEVLVYAATLGRAGVSVDLHLYPGVPHAFEAIAPGCAAAPQAWENRFRAIKTIKAVKGAKL